MEIRRMTEQDAAAAAEIERLCFSSPWTEEMLRGDLRSPDTRYFAAWIDGKMAAYMGLWLAMDEGHITNVATAPEFRRKGCASALIERCVSLAGEKKLVLLTLEVRRGNAAAIALYEKCGFECVGVRPRYYENREDALIMTRYTDKDGRI